MLSSPVRFWFSAGLMVPAAVLFGWFALTNAGTEGVGRSFTVYGTLSATSVSVLLLALIRRGERRDGPGGAATATGADESGPFWFGARATFALCLSLFLLVLAAAAWDVLSPAPVDGYRVPFIDFSAYGVALGGAFLLVGFIIMSLAPRALGGPRPRRFVAAGVGLLVTSTVCVTVFMATVVSPVDAVPAADGTGEAATAPVPGQVSEAAWEWRTPGDGSVYQVVPAGAGVVVRHASGVTALETVEGEEVWHFRRAEERTRDVVASPGGDRVAVTFLARGGAGEYRLRLVVLDAHTGEVRAEHEAPHHPGTGDGLNLPDGFTLTGEGTYIQTVRFDDPAENHVVAHDLDSGDQVWDFVPPEDCYLTAHEEAGARHLLGDEALVVMQCSPEAAEHDPKYTRYPPEVHDQDIVVLGLDPADGTQVWRHEQLVTAEWISVSARVGSDHDIVTVEWSEGPAADKPGGRVFIGPGGGEIHREAEMQYPYIHSPTQDGYLDLKTRTDDGAADVWRTFEGGERTAHSPIPTVNGGVDKCVLENAVVTVTHVFDPEDDELITTVTVEPWFDVEGAERHEFEVDLFLDQDYGHRDRVALLPTHGSVVLTAGTPLVVGLA